MTSAAWGEGWAGCQSTSLESARSHALGNIRVSSTTDAGSTKMFFFFQRGEQFCAISALACTVPFVRLGPSFMLNFALVFVHGVMELLVRAIEGNVPTLCATSGPSFKFEKGMLIRFELVFGWIWQEMCTRSFYTGTGMDHNHGCGSGGSCGIY